MDLAFSCRRWLTRIARCLWVIVVVGSSSGCLRGLNLQEQPAARGDLHHLESHLVPTADFDLSVNVRVTREPVATLIVYIEGDGRAYRSRRRVSDDPTPQKAVARELAQADPTDAVAYIARPCQFTGGLSARNCTAEAWTTGRYSERVIASMAEALEWLNLRYTPKRFGLVGFSGGGAVAALIAARDARVAWLVTIAGNLDHRYWTATHGVSPLDESLNPVDVAHLMGPIPQLHLYGQQDELVPADVAQRYYAQLRHPQTAVLATIKDFDHHCCWASVWPELLCEHGFDAHPACR